MTSYEDMVRRAMFQVIGEKYYADHYELSRDEIELILVDLTEEIIDEVFTRIDEMRLR